jgi:flagellar biosynthesis anti-sigma factor FlgM
MRINPNQAAPTVSQSSRSSGQSAANTAIRSSGGTPLGQDQAQLSDIHAQVQTLTAQAAQLPEVRQEKVNALRQAVLGGSYRPGASQVAEGLFAHMVVKAA